MMIQARAASVNPYLGKYFIRGRALIVHDKLILPQTENLAKAMLLYGIWKAEFQVLICLLSFMNEGFYYVHIFCPLNELLVDHGFFCPSFTDCPLFFGCVCVCLSLPLSSAASMGSQQSPSQFSQNVDNNDISSDVLVSEQTTGKEDTWSNRVKKRELSLDDVGSTIGASSAPSSMGNTLSTSAKGKRSERDRDGKGHNREVLSRNGTAKIGRPSLSSNAKGERKSKTKPKQKTTQLSVSVNGLLGKITEQPKAAMPSVSKSNDMTTSTNAKEKDDFGLDVLDDPEAIDLSHLQIPEMDVLGVPDDLDAQEQDLGSWLNIDVDGLQDHDFMGLEIPMDDLSDLNMMV